MMLHENSVTSKPLLTNKVLKAELGDMYFKTSIESTKVLSQIKIKIITEDAKFSFDLQKNTENEAEMKVSKDMMIDNTIDNIIDNTIELVSEFMNSSEIEESLSKKNTDTLTYIENNSINHKFKIGVPIIVAIDKYINGNNEIIIYDLDTNNEVKKFITTPESDNIKEIFAVGIFPDNKTIICCGTDKNDNSSIFVWDIENIINVHTHPDHNTISGSDGGNHKITSFAISPSSVSKIYAVGFENGDVCIKSLLCGVSYYYRTMDGPMRNISFSLTGVSLIMDSNHTYTLNTSQFMIFKRLYSSKVIIKSFWVYGSDNIDHVCFLNAHGDVEMYTSDTGTQPLHEDHLSMNNLSISPDRKTLALFNDNIVVIWNDNKIYKRLGFHETHISNVYFTPNKQEIIIQGGKTLLRYIIDDSHSNVMAFDRSFGSEGDGKWLVAVSIND